MRRINFKKAVAQKFKEYDQKLEALTNFNVPEAFEKAIQAKVLIEMKKLLPTNILKAVANYSNTTHPTNQKLYDTLYESVYLDHDTLNAQDADASFHKRSHDNQDPLNNREEKNMKKRRKDVGGPSSRSSRRNKYLMKSRSANAKRRTTWFGLLLKSDIDKNENQILRPSIVAIAKKLKELIQKDELTIADLEGAGLEKLKQQYKNDVELKYHVKKLKAAVLTEAKWNSDEDEVSKPRTTEGNVYSDLRIKSVVRIEVKKKRGYGFLTSIVVKRSDDKEVTLVSFTIFKSVWETLGISSEDSSSDTAIDCSEGRGRNPTSSRRTDSTPVYDSDGSAEYTELLEHIPEPQQVPQNDNNVISEVTDVEQGGETVEQHPVNFEETRALYDSLYQNLAIEVKKVNSHASTSDTQTDKAPIYDSGELAEVHNYENCYDNEIFSMFTQEEQYTKLLEPIPKPHQVLQNDSNVIYEVSSVEQDGRIVDQHLAAVEETHAYFESLYNNLEIKVEKVNSVNRKMK
nr:hypothetical protein [Tanacetum cinerariifolium]